MAGKDWEVSFDAIASILFEEFDQPASMSPKAFYKIIYFIDKKLSQQGFTTGVDHFWYKYGTMTVTAGSAVAIERSGDRSEVLCSVKPDELELDPTTENEIRSATRDVLAEYERLNTEGLTDQMYEEAPYEFQRQYRELDGIIQSQIRTHGEGGKEFTREEIRNQMHEFIRSFPEEEFPKFANDLYLWYDILSTALDDTTTSIGDIEDIAEVFWTIVMVEIATNPGTGVNPRVLENELNIDDSEGLQGYLQYLLGQLEDEYLWIENGSESIPNVADAVMASQLDFVEI